MSMQPSGQPSTHSPTHSPTHLGHRPRGVIWFLFAAVVLGMIAAFLWFSGVFKTEPRVAIVTASQGPYWDLIIKGAQDAAARHHVKLDVFRPESDVALQSKAIGALIGQGYSGVAISPNDADRQARVLSDLANETNLLTFDADAPISRRLCFVGTDNYDAGRMCGQKVREALPQGGTVILSIGSVEKENGQRRRQGVIDELLGRTFEPNRPADPVDGALKGENYTVLATLVDNYDPGRATDLAAAALKDHPDVGCFVGLFASSTPAVLDALERAGGLGKVQVVGFDANEQTLAGIEKGHVYASIVQDAYNIGYSSLRILADAAHGEANAVPLFPTFYLRCDEVTRDNLAEMRAAMSSRNKPTTRSTRPNDVEKPASRPGAPTSDAESRPAPDAQPATEPAAGS